MSRSARPGGARFAVRGNTRVAYDPGAYSETEATVPTVVLLHALLGDRTTFAAQRDALAEDNRIHYRVILPDARGHGASATLANQWYSVAELAADLIAILDAERITSAHLVGHELGGAIAFEVARRHPERVDSLTLIEPALFSLADNDPAAEARAAREERRAGDRAAGDAAYKGLIDRALDGYLAPRWGAAWRAEATKARLGAIRRHAGALPGILPALDAYTVSRAGAGAMAVPTLILCGEDATLLDRLVCARLANWLPEARLETVHLAARPNAPLGGEAAPKVNGLVDEFLSSLDRG